MTISLREITMKTFHECNTISLTGEQTHFVVSNMYSLAEAKADNVFCSLAIYADDQMVGFIRTKKIYESLGFKSTGEICVGDAVMVIEKWEK